MAKAIVFMSAIVPTTGHLDLIKFAVSLCHYATEPFKFSVVPQVHVIVSGLRSEPTHVTQRVAALRRDLSNFGDGVVFHAHLDDEAPQYPDGDNDPQFWDYWYNTSRALCGINEFAYVVASEPYGAPLAARFGATFVPYDIGRNINPARGTWVRGSPLRRWDQIAPGFRRNLVTVCTVFGQESVGKTTLVQQAANTDTGIAIGGASEWARGYLEAVGPELTEEKMATIVLGQAAQQDMMRREAVTPVILQDTDLYSTIGYYCINGMRPPMQLESLAWGLRSDMYYLLRDNVPFEPDPLRYGGDKRESTFEFWENLLIQYKLPYTIIEPEGRFSRMVAVVGNVTDLAEKKVARIVNYQRQLS